MTMCAPQPTPPVGMRCLTANELLLCLREMHRGAPIAVANKRDFVKDRLKLRNRIYAGELPGLSPNRFWYVSPAGVLALKDIPMFAGWLECENGQLVPRRTAPLLHRECHGVEVLMRLARAMRDRDARGKGGIG